jgi:hypothetical protein
MTIIDVLAAAVSFLRDQHVGRRQMCEHMLR